MLPKVRNQLIQSIHDFSRQRIVVIGDLILDQYTWGRVDRISPEAPIPIVRVEKEEFRLGGAASAVANVHALDCDVFPVGLIGQDMAGRQLQEIFHEKNIPTEGLVVVEGFQTIVKKRVLTKQQQLIRVDYESPVLHSDEYDELLIQKIKLILGKVDAVILSDYAKGVLSQRVIRETIQEASQRKIPVICDPGKGKDISWYRGVTTIKPNRLETEQATGIPLKDPSSILRAAAKLQEKCQSHFLSISLDKDGILLYRNEKDYQFIATEVLEVFDVTGAGDIVISILGVLLAQGVAEDLTLHMANVAAELEISHMGVVPIPWSDILEHLEKDGLSQKITSIDYLRGELQTLGDAPLLFTNGYFDQLSAGHLRFLVEISNIPGRLIVAINSDQSILREKGSLPLLNQKDRARLLASLENVYRVLIFDEVDASYLIRTLTPDVVIKGAAFQGQQIPEQEAIQAIGAEIKYIKHFSW
ncbi:MAG: hypothetical protein COB67_08075 [SAR324 cluster bacterium]|uniref:Bifunctional heptose 7-phosphate kinase/heptose 1-phosphate adenyltransferase n=1 Tax=SAR324 cluster bacterium TaxID=2024889 RepID=A0A2A4T2U3_9DELT|nr:MAG: hypothetical protein COB67_08075 [SAR324 cluster bacterium]